MQNRQGCSWENEAVTDRQESQYMPSPSRSYKIYANTGLGNVQVTEKHLLLPLQWLLMGSAFIRLTVQNDLLDDFYEPFAVCEVCLK